MLEKVRKKGWHLLDRLESLHPIVLPPPTSIPLSYCHLRFFDPPSILSLLPCSPETMVYQHGDEHDVPQEHNVARPGAWLPADNRIHRVSIPGAALWKWFNVRDAVSNFSQAWLAKQIEDARRNPKELEPCLKDFKKFIEGTPRIYMYFNAMYDPHNSPQYHCCSLTAGSMRSRRRSRTRRTRLVTSKSETTTTCSRS